MSVMSERADTQSDAAYIILLAEQLRIWATTTDRKVKSNAQVNFTKLLKSADRDLQLKSLMLMCDIMVEYAERSGLLATQIIKTLDLEDHAKRLYDETDYKNHIVAAMILGMNVTLGCFEESNKAVASVVSKITGHKIDINAAIASQVGNLFYGPLWTQLYFNEWSAEVPYSKKLEDVLFPTIIINPIEEPVTTETNLPDNLSL